MLKFNVGHKLEKITIRPSYNRPVINLLVIISRRWDCKIQMMRLKQQIKPQTR